MKNKWELYGMYVSRVVITDGVIKELDIAIDNLVIWSTDKARTGTYIEGETA